MMSVEQLTLRIDDRGSLGEEEFAKEMLLHGVYALIPPKGVRGTHTFALKFNLALIAIERCDPWEIRSGLDLLKSAAKITRRKTVRPGPVTCKVVESSGEEGGFTEGYLHFKEGLFRLAKPNESFHRELVFRNFFELVRAMAVTVEEDSKYSHPEILNWVKMKVARKFLGL